MMTRYPNIWRGLVSVVLFFALVAGIVFAICSVTGCVTVGQREASIIEQQAVVATEKAQRSPGDAYLQSNADAWRWWSDYANGKKPERSEP